MSTHISEAIEQEMNGLIRLRDELRLQMHLAQAEAREAFYRLEERWPELESRAAKLREQGSEGAHELAEAAKDLGRELRSGYEEVRRRVVGHA